MYSVTAADCTAHLLIYANSEPPLLLLKYGHSIHALH